MSKGINTTKANSTAALLNRSQNDVWEVFAAYTTQQTHIMIKGRAVKLGRGK